MTAATVLLANPGADLYGSDRMALETVEALIGAGHRVVVTSPQDGPLLGLARETGAETVILPTPVVRKSALRPAGMVRLFAEAVRSIRPGIRLLRRERPGAIIVNTITPPLWFLLGRITRTPVICHAHEAEASVPTPLRVLLTSPLLLVDRLMVNSEFCREVLTSTLPPLHRKAVVVYNAVSGPTERTPPRAELRDPIRLLYVGRLSARKGVDVAVRAVAVLRDRDVHAELSIVGAVFPGNEQFHQSLVETTKELDIEDRVRLVGFRSDRWPETAAADIALVPSVGDESFGNVVIEAALAARPQVVSDFSGLREAAAGIRSVVPVPVGDPGAIADAVQKIAEGWHHYRSAAAADAESLTHRYATTRYATDVDRVVTDVMTSRR